MKIYRKEYKMDISKRLKELINLNNMNVKEFSEYVGITRTSLTGYLNQKVTPTIDPLVQICDKCGVSLDWLCSREDKRHFLTMADIIKSLRELHHLDSFKYTLTIENEKEGLTSDNYKCTIVINGKWDVIGDIDYQGYLCKFLYDYKRTDEQLKNLPDDELKNNYWKMWWEKQLAYYSTIPIMKPESIFDGFDLFDEFFGTNPKLKSSDVGEK